MAPLHAFVDGRLIGIEEAALRADDSAACSGRGCYTSARWAGGRVRFGARSARRLARDARTLELGEVDVAQCQEGMHALGHACFGDGEGIVRFQASRDGSGLLHVTGTARAIGESPASWHATTAPFPHEGPAPWAGAKVTNHLRFALAREHAAARGADEALLFDPAGRLVEGARSNLIILDDAGPVTPPLSRGAVAGVCLEILRERFPALREQDVDRKRLLAAREVLAVNSVRFVVPVGSLDGRPLATGEGGSLCAEFGQALASED